MWKSYIKVVVSAIFMEFALVCGTANINMEWSEGVGEVKEELNILSRFKILQECVPIQTSK